MELYKQAAQELGNISVRSASEEELNKQVRPVTGSRALKEGNIAVSVSRTDHNEDGQLNADLSAFWARVKELKNTEEQS